jgi:hypothetical protein
MASGTTTRICAVDECEKPRAGRSSLCSMHKTRRVRGCDFNKPQRLVGDLPTRFWPKVTPAAAEDCWEWVAKRNNRGYGVIYDNIAKTSVLAHRAAYEMLRADIPEGLQLDHLCRNRGCVNPWHLEPVTNRVNTLRGARTIRSMMGGHGAN